MAASNSLGVLGGLNDPSNQALTPESLARKRRMAEIMMYGSGGNGEPIRSPWQGAAALANAFVGNLKNHQLDEAEQAAIAQKNAQLARATGADGVGSGYSFQPPGQSQSFTDQSIPSPQNAPSAAPAGPLPRNRDAFIAALMPAAVEASKQTGVDPRLIVGQAAIESGWGQHAPGNNYFGIKSHGQPGGNQLATTEYENGQPVRTSASFRAYASPEDSVKGYADFITQNPRYSALRSAPDLDSQLAALGKSGYATDPNYANMVGRIARALQVPPVGTASDSGGALPSSRIQAFAQAFGMPTQVASLDPTAGIGRQAPPVPQIPPQTQAGSQVGIAPTIQITPGSSGRINNPGGAMLPGGLSSSMGSMPPDGNSRQDAAAASVPPALADARNGAASGTMNPEAITRAAARPEVQSMAQAAAQTPRGDGILQATQNLGLQQVMQAISNPWMAPEERALLLMVAKQKIDQSNPVTQQMQSLQLQKLQQEVTGGQYEKLNDGTLYDKRTGKAVSVGAPAFRPLTDQSERARYGILADDTSPYQVDAAGKLMSAGRAGTTVNVEQKGESSFNQALGAAQGKMFAGMIEDGTAARSDLGMIDQLRTQLGQLPGGFIGGAQAMANNLGIKLGPNPSALEAAQAIIAQLVPKQRVPGAGTTSDRDLTQFQRSLPQLSNTAAGNALILDTMQGLAEYRVAQSEIANALASGDMTRAEALQAIRAISDPFAKFKAMRDKQGAPAENPSDLKSKYGLE